MKSKIQNDERDGLLADYNAFCKARRAQQKAAAEVDAARTKFSDAEVEMHLATERLAAHMVPECPTRILRLADGRIARIHHRQTRGIAYESPMFRIPCLDGYTLHRSPEVDQLTIETFAEDGAIEKVA